MSKPQETSQAAEFNPYRVWLGIPLNKLPADHYSLLGLEKYESDDDVIAAAADRVMVFVKTFQTGKYSEQSQQILNEIAAARICLLNKSAKTEYDKTLHSAEKEEVSESSVPVSAPPIVPPGVESPSHVLNFNFDLDTTGESRTKVSSVHKRSAIGSRKNKADKVKPAAHKEESEEIAVAPVPFWLMGLVGALALILLIGIVFLLLGFGGSKTVSTNDSAQTETKENPNPVDLSVGKSEEAEKSEEKKTSGNSSDKIDPVVVTPPEVKPEPSPSTANSVDETKEAEANTAEEPAQATGFELPPPSGDTASLFPEDAAPAPEPAASDTPVNIPALQPSVPAEPEPPKQIVHTVVGHDFPTAEKAGDKHVVTVDNIEYVFRWIPSGSFMMGSPETEPGRKENERQHSETISSGFWILETEITAEMFAAVMGTAKPSESVKNNPAMNVSFNQALEFCDRLSRFSNMYVALPSEVQWEYACRAGTSTAYNYGSSASELYQKANYCDKEFPSEREGKDMEHSDAFPRMAPVRSFPPNAWGLYDMHGNVEEWCAYPSANVPVDATNTLIGVYKGGSYYSPSSDCRSAARAAKNYTGNPSGFRIVRRAATAPTPNIAATRPILSDRTPSDGDISLPGKRPGQRAVKKFGNVEFKFRWCPPGETKAFRTTKTDIVITHGFWMLETEVTQAMYEEVMGENPAFFKGESNPVEQVSWNDAQKFCKTLSDRWKDVTVYLPTEVQWIHAGRAGSMEQFSCGPKLPTDAANCNAQSPCIGQPRGVFTASTLPVGSYAPNAWGLYDIHGNVAEWCFDRYESTYRYQRTKDEMYYDPTGSPVGANRIFHGGSWLDPFASAVFYGGYSYALPSEDSYRTGFRICTLPEGQSWAGREQLAPPRSEFFANQPDSVDLPESTSEEFTTLLTVQKDTDVPWILSSLGLEQFKTGAFSYAFTQTGENPADAQWKFTLNLQNGESLEIAQLKKEGNALKFRFTDTTGNEAAQMIRNTILKIQIDSDIHYLALRKPYLVKENVFNCFDGGLIIKPELKYLPKQLTRVLYRIYPLDNPPTACVMPDGAFPITSKQGAIKFVFEGKLPIAIRPEFIPSSGMMCKFTLEADKAIKQGFSAYLAAKATVDKTAEENKAIISNLKSKLSSGAGSPKMKQDLFKLMFYQWGANFMKKASEKAPLVHFEVYLDCGGRRLTLIAIQPPPPPVVN